MAQADPIELPSEHFVLADEYRELDGTDAKVMLQERTKELAAIKRANELFGAVTGPVGPHAETYVEELPAWFQYPDVTEAELSIGSKHYSSSGYRETDHPLSTTVRTDQGTTIELVIVYTEERPAEDDGPWLTEEQELIDVIVGYVKTYLAQIENQRSVAEDVKTGVDDIQETADEMAESTERISGLATDQADSMVGVASEIADMSATVEEIASTAEEVAATSGRAETLTTDGQEAATEAIDVMEAVDDSASEVVADFSSLQDRIDEIDEIVEVINDIADQTNLLALNASIEAATAGEAGDGFAVVANEVKSLAEESQSHASEIEGVIDEIKSDTAHTVASLEETTQQIDMGIDQVTEAMETLADIAETVQEASHGIQEVSDATDDQAASSEQVANTVDELVEVAKQVADEIQQVAQANERQVALASEIGRTVDDLTTNQSH